MLINIMIVVSLLVLLMLWIGFAISFSNLIVHILAVVIDDLEWLYKERIRPLYYRTVHHVYVQIKLSYKHRKKRA